MKKTQKQFIFCLLFSLCLPLMSYAQVETVSATILNFSDYVKGPGTNPVTLTITDRYLRIDDNINKDIETDNGFVLYDRQESVIYSVSSDEQQTVTIKMLPVTIPSPMELKLHSVKQAVDKEAPLIDGKETKKYQIFVNDKLCSETVTVPGLMPDAVQAMGEFQQVLAGQQAETLRYIPADLHEACDLARHTFYPKSHLENGFPLIVQEIDQSKKDKSVQRSRALLNYKKQDVSAELFVLPDYSIIPLN